MSTKTMTNEQIRLIRESWARVEPIADDAAAQGQSTDGSPALELAPAGRT
jgi:hypothetical protein